MILLTLTTKYHLPQDKSANINLEVKNKLTFFFCSDNTDSSSSCLVSVILSFKQCQH